MKKYGAPCVFLIFLALLVGYFSHGAGKSSLVSVPEKQKSSGVLIVLDAGHGGEDGGALAPDGTAEKDLNLRIAKDTAAFFDLFGIPYVMTRTGDVSVCDEGLSTIRERKRSDINNRYALVNSGENNVLLSIHQNTFGQSRFSGAQVFFAGHVEQSRIFAACLRESIVPALQPQNTREIKPSGDSVFLLYKAKRPSVLVECGFLSNERELALLETPSYQKSMAFRIAVGTLRYLNQEVISWHKKTNPLTFAPPAATFPRNGTANARNSANGTRWRNS